MCCTLWTYYSTSKWNIYLESSGMMLSQWAPLLLGGTPGLASMLSFFSTATGCYFHSESLLFWTYCRSRVSLASSWFEGFKSPQPVRKLTQWWPHWSRPRECELILALHSWDLKYFSLGPETFRLSSSVGLLKSLHPWHLLLVCLPEPGLALTTLGQTWAQV